MRIHNSVTKWHEKEWLLWAAEAWKYISHFKFKQQIQEEKELRANVNMYIVAKIQWTQKEWWWSICIILWRVLTPDVHCLWFFWNRCTMLQVILTPTCRMSGYPRQVIKVDALLRRLRFIWTALPTVITLITIIPLGTYNTLSWYIFLFSLMTAVCLSLSWLGCFTGLLPFLLCFLLLLSFLLLLLSFYNFGLTG
jgi:hypothetical protein